jgi:hypothetical protein
MPRTSDVVTTMYYTGLDPLTGEGSRRRQERSYQATCLLETGNDREGERGYWSARRAIEAYSDHFG